MRPRDEARVRPLADPTSDPKSARFWYKALAFDTLFWSFLGYFGAQKKET